MNLTETRDRLAEEYRRSDKDISDGFEAGWNACHALMEEREASININKILDAGVEMRKKTVWMRKYLDMKNSYLSVCGANWETSTAIYKLNRQLTRSEQRERELTAALEFYANKKNWSRNTYDEVSIDGDDVAWSPNGQYYPGQRAIKALAKNEEKE